LKTPKDADSESLQAKWIKDLGELNLRANDILPIIERARSYHARRDECWHGCLLPSVRPLRKLLLRLVVCIRKRSKYE
jgi:8-oxo-dGDP phosphatase